MYDAPACIDGESLKIPQGARILNHSVQSTPSFVFVGHQPNTFCFLIYFLQGSQKIRTSPPETAKKTLET